MKKIAFIFVFCTSFVFASESLEIEKNKVFEKVIETKTMQATFSLNGKNKHENILEHSISKVIDIAKKADCFGGQYRVRPNYIYDKNIQIMDGYSAQVSFKCEFTNSDVYETALQEIKKIDTLNLTQGEISYILTKETISKTHESLELDALKYATSYAKMLDKNLTEYKNCMISKVFFKEGGFSNFPNVRMAKTFRQQDESTTVTAPIENQKTVSLQADYTFKCQQK